MQLPVHYERPWQEIAAQKRKTLLELIPQDWLLPADVLTRAEDTPKLVGDFIESLLDLESLEITASDPVDILARISEGTYSAVQVTNAFCKRAAYAHQLVKFPSSAFPSFSELTVSRITMSSNSSSKRPSNRQKSLTSITRNTVKLLVLYMVYLLA